MIYCIFIKNVIRKFDKIKEQNQCFEQMLVKSKEKKKVDHQEIIYEKAELIKLLVSEKISLSKPINTSIIKLYLGSPDKSILDAFLFEFEKSCKT